MLLNDVWFMGSLGAMLSNFLNNCQQLHIILAVLHRVLLQVESFEPIVYHVLNLLQQSIVLWPLIRLQFAEDEHIVKINLEGTESWKHYNLLGLLIEVLVLLA
jgi:hypothetical protein